MYYTVKENDKLDVKVGLEDQDKTFVFKDVDPADTKKVDVSLKEDKVNLDVTKKDGTTATLTPSEDSAKTEDEKKEEKKEETAKADTSNKSNSSESKKNNTASTSSNSNKNNSSSSSSKPSSKPSNSSSNNSGSSKPSNNSGSSSSNSKPAEHKHEWVAQYKTVTVPEKGHNEQVLVQAAYDEQVPQYKDVERQICSACGVDITDLGQAGISAHIKAHALAGENGGYHSEVRQVLIGYSTVHHEAVYETRYVVDSPATTKQELTGYKCSSCGKTK